MDSYRREVFDFLIKPANFDSLVLAMNHFEDIRKELLTEFWKLVKVEIETKIVGSTWIVQADNNIYAKYSKIQLLKPEWRTSNDKYLFSITWENLSGRPYQGLLCYADNPNHNMPAIKEKIFKVEKPEGYTSGGNTYWVWWSNADLDFSNPNGVSKILPERAQQLASEWATELYELAIRHEKELDTICTLKNG